MLDCDRGLILVRESGGKGGPAGTGQRANLTNSTPTACGGQAARRVARRRALLRPQDHQLAAMNRLAAAVRGRSAVRLPARLPAARPPPRPNRWAPSCRLCSDQPRLPPPSADPSASPCASASASASGGGDGSGQALGAVGGVKTPGPKMSMTFTCTVCETRSTKIFHRHSYERGTVIVTCPGCKSHHLVADNLGWFLDGPEGTNIEDIMASKGETVRRVVDADDPEGAEGTSEFLPADEGAAPGRIQRAPEYMRTPAQDAVSAASAVTTLIRAQQPFHETHAVPARAELEKLEGLRRGMLRPVTRRRRGGQAARREMAECRWRICSRRWMRWGWTTQEGERRNTHARTRRRSADGAPRPQPRPLPPLALTRVLWAELARSLPWSLAARSGRSRTGRWHNCRMRCASTSPPPLRVVVPLIHVSYIVTRTTPRAVLSRARRLPNSSLSTPKRRSCSAVQLLPTPLGGHRARRPSPWRARARSHVPDGRSLLLTAT